jgi:hypothetical protein
MTLSQRAIEAAAAQADPDLWETDEFGCFVRGKTTERNISRKVMERCITTALAVDGVALVPKEPTVAMLDAGEETFVSGYSGTPVSTPASVWTAMLAAANDGEERPTPPAGTGE